MKIVSRGNKTSAKFRVIKDNFCLPGGVRPEIGQVLEYIGRDNLAEAVGLCQRGCLSPEDLPKIGTYICVAPFYLPGEKEKFQAAPGDLVSLKGEDALKLILSGKVRPQDPSRWCPFVLKERRKIKDIMGDAQYSDGKTKISHDWKVKK